MEESSELKYMSPKEAKEQEESPQHRFDLYLNGEKIGGAELDYFSKPIPLYQLTDLYINHEHHNKGYASRVLSQVEEFLVERKRPGVLVDAVLDLEGAAGMYGRRGWEKVEDSAHLYTYNWPENIPQAALRGYAQRYTDLLARPKSDSL